MPATLLDDRGVLRLSGEEAPAFLQGLVSNDVENLPENEARFVALLSPQGKIQCDFFVVHPRGTAPGELFIDCPKERLADLGRRLTTYKLRARVNIEDASSALRVAVAWPPPGDWDLGPVAYEDPRHSCAGTRAFIENASDSFLRSGEEAYEAHRIFLGLPKGGVDFLYGDAFPHEANMDKLNGLDFRKGCYVGQEVVSRMQHRGTARSRVLRVSFVGASPEPSTEVRAGEILLGRMGSAARGQGLAMLRTDRVEEALSAGFPIQAGQVELHVLPSGP